jgi:hypothetical protein
MWSSLCQEDEAGYICGVNYVWRMRQAIYLSGVNYVWRMRQAIYVELIRSGG